MPAMRPSGQRCLTIFEEIADCAFFGSHGVSREISGVPELINGVEVSKAKKVPTQVNIKDSYARLDTLEEVKKQLLMLARSLIHRMHADLTEDDDDFNSLEGGPSQRKWLAHPRTLRLSTRPPPPLKPDGSRARSFNRISRSTLMPNFAFNLNQSDECLAEKLVQEALIPAFRKLRPEKLGWNLSLVNIVVTNMSETAAESKDSVGRDIGRMLKRQDEVLQDWKVVDEQPVVEDDSPINTEMDRATSTAARGQWHFLPGWMGEGRMGERRLSRQLDACLQNMWQRDTIVCGNSS